MTQRGIDREDRAERRRAGTLGACVGRAPRNQRAPSSGVSATAEKLRKDARDRVIYTIL